MSHHTEKPSAQRLPALCRMQANVKQNKPLSSSCETYSGVRTPHLQVYGTPFWLYPLCLRVRCILVRHDLFKIQFLNVLDIRVVILWSSTFAGVLTTSRKHRIDNRPQKDHTEYFGFDVLLTLIHSDGTVIVFPSSPNQTRTQTSFISRLGQLFWQNSCVRDMLAPFCSNPYWFIWQVPWCVLPQNHAGLILLSWGRAHSLKFSASMLACAIAKRTTFK